MQGVGVRYRFFGDENRRLQPFARIGLARANVRFEGVSSGVISETLPTGVSVSTIIFRLIESEISDDSIYYGIGASYALDGGWRASAQVLHVPVKVAHLSFGRTEALIGIQYAF